MIYIADIFLALLIVALGSLIYILIKYVPIIEKNAFDVPRYQPPADSEPPEDIKVRKFQIPYDTRNAIDAHYIKSRKAKRKLVVFCHETGADLNSWYKHAYFLPDDGVDVLSFNFKPNPIRPEFAGKDSQYFQWPSVQELRVLERVLSWVALERKGFEVALFGISKGATVAAAAAPSPIIKAVLLDGAFSTHLTLREYMKKFVNIYVSPKRLAQGVPNWLYILLSYSTLVYASIRRGLRFISIERFIAKLRKPVFWIHAGKDYHVRLEHVDRLRNRIPGSTHLWVAEAAGHSEAAITYPSEYKSKIVNFIKRSLD